MKKISITATFMLVLMLMALGPLPARAEPQKVKRSLAFDVLPFREELIDAVDFSATTTTIDKFSDPTPFWVDIVDAEGYDGGEGVYVAVLDTGLLEQWPFFFTNPLTGECRIKAEWGKGFTHDIW
ncbi:MAG: hypothetical protein QXU67_00395, partial [Candidatus Bathyarchaeia archaeon]